MSHPKFVVIGHPNKGKSTIVSALTLNDTIAISDTPGTTKESRQFYLKADDKILYELIDTPGFQRPKKLLEYLKSFGDVGALERPKLIEKFVNENIDNPRFHDEVELLKPIIDGAAILYVVDASKPYSNEYETQMEILRYTAAPSMAILNYIDNTDYTKEWDMVLGQYFRLIKRFNPMQYNIKEHKSLLNAMSHINPLWEEQMQESIEYLDIFYNNLIDKISATIAKAVKDAISLKLESSYSSLISSQERLQKKFIKQIESIEKSMQNRIKEILRFKNLELDIKDSPLQYELFSTKSQEIFGLKKDKLVKISALSGALIGGSVDLALAGHTFFLGALLGGAAGAVGAMYGFDEIAKINFIGTSKMEVGPIKDANFGFIFLNRALIYAKDLLNKSHANRKKEIINLKDANLEIKDGDLRKLAILHKSFKMKKAILQSMKK